jgi:ribosomal protein L16 Arg81 hydroxylase
VSPGQFQASLEWLIHPVGKQEFFDGYFEKKPLVVHRKQPGYFGHLLTLDEIDRVLTTLDRHYPDVVLKNASRDIESGDYTVDDETLDIGRLCQLFVEGSTVSLAFLDTVVPALTGMCRSLEAEFSCPFQANVYLTPASAQGAKVHYDTHDVFVLQAAGSKQWTLYGTPVELPFAGQDYDAAIHQPGEPTLEFCLDTGDVAYIPRGVVHDARSTDSVSLHVTVGILRYTWTDLLLEVVAGRALRDPAFRKALPPGFHRAEFDRAEARKTLRDLLRRVSADPDLDGALDNFIAEFLSSCPPVLRGQMAQLAGLNDLTADSRAGARPGVIFRLRDAGQAVAIECYGRTITLPLQAREAVCYALSHAAFAIRDLPGRLDEAGKLTLIRRLIREGLVVARPRS